MCGRFVGYRKKEELQEYFPIDTATCELTENYNIAPGQTVLAIARIDGLNHLTGMRWGLVPFWATDLSIGNKLINARAETVATKPSFRTAFKKRRCLILADGFYEWVGKKGEKQPVYITLPDEKPFAFAGLWEVWDNKGENEEKHKSCTIITTAASESISKIHHRIPAILKPDRYESWLNPDLQDSEEVQRILNEGIYEEFVSRPVSKKMNSTKSNEKSNIQQQTLPGF